MPLQHRIFEVSLYFYDLNIWGMINLLFITLTVMGLVFLFFQQRMNSKQEDWIKNETKALKKLRKKNKSFYFNKSSSTEKKVDFPPHLLKPLNKKVPPQVRNFEFPKPVKRRAKTSVISN